jgi:hypothetical protein
MPIIEIKISGINDLLMDYKKFRFDMKNNMVLPLDESAAKYLKVISANFNSQGQVFGNPWPPLSEATIRDKQSLMKKGKAISTKPLIRTGRLKSGFGRDLVGLYEARVFNTQKYSILHNEGGTANYKGKQVVIPKRVLADVDDARISMVASVFTSWLGRIIVANKM